MENLTQRVIAVFAAELLTRPARLSPLTELSEDLQLDPVERAVIGEALEEEFGIVVGPAAMQFVTIEDAVEFVAHAKALPFVPAYAEMQRLAA